MSGSMINQLSYLYLSFRNFINPLYGDFSSLEALEYLFYRYGWNIFLQDSIFSEINQIAGLPALLQQLFTQADALEQKIANDPNYSLSTQDIEGILSTAKQIYTVIKGMETADISTLISPLNSSDFWVDIGEQLLNDLQETFLRIYYPKAYAFLHLFGVVRYEAVTATDPSHIDYIKTVVDWAQAVNVIKNPLDAFHQIYHWNDPANAFDHQGLLSALEKALRSLGLMARLNAPTQQTIAGLSSTAGLAIQQDVNSLRILFLEGLGVSQPATYEVGLEILPAVKTGDTVPSGLLLKPVLQAGTGVNFPFGKQFQLQLSAAVDAGESLMLSVFPSAVNLITNLPTITAGLTFSRPDTPTPWYLVGNANTARIELSGISLNLSLEGTITDPELKFSFQLGKDPSTPGCKVVIPLGESDQFIKNGVSSSGINFAFGGNILWSSKTGLRFSGEASLDIMIPFTLKIGAVTLKNAHLQLQESSKSTPPTGAELRVGTQIGGNFGPISFEVDDMGLSAVATPYSDQDLQNLPPGSSQPLFGNLDFSLSFAPPKGIGISVDASVVSGSGYLFFDTDKGEYGGVADLNIKDKINIKAFGVILTHMPDGSPGYSFLLMISAEFPAIQLGLGFSLTGLGGLIGIHRSIDTDALEQGVYNNDVANVLFPSDPLHNAYALLASIDRLFPPLEGAYTFGIMAKLAWGPKDLITIELGLILEFPDPVRLALIGVLRAVISKTLSGKNVTVLNLQVNFAGSIDFDEKYIRFDASLYQSKLLDMKLEGDMALRVKWGDNSDFVVTLGGFNPTFQPPALDLPAQIHRIQIILLSGNPSLSVGCYMAVTTNTFQFGVAGLFTFNKWGVGIKGELTFDALFQRNPFHFTTDLHFLLSASWKGYTFASLEIDGSFDGPSPWDIKASLTLSVWIFSKTISLDETWGDADDTVADLIDILPLLAADLQNISNWEHGNGNSNLCVAIRKPTVPNADAATVLYLHANEILTVRQSTVPLDIQIDKFSAGTPLNANTFSIVMQQNGAAISAATVQDRFASAQFVSMTEEQELSAPSYELFDSGLNFSGMDFVVFDQYTTQTLSYETSVIDDPSMIPQPTSTVQESGLNFIHGLLNNAVSNSSLGKFGGTIVPPSKIIGEKFVIVNQQTFTAAAGGATVSSQAQANQIMQQMKNADTKGVLSLAVLPQSELS
jgi:hypothetical protein